MVLYRGLSLPREKISEQFALGNKVTLHEFVSCDRNEATARKFIKRHLAWGREPVMLKIQLREYSADFFDASELSVFKQKESEVILQHGLEYQVTSVGKTYDLDLDRNITIVYLCYPC